MTTLMLRNIPNNHDPEKMQILLDDLGFAGKYDFVYLPRDFRSRAALGYGFVNFTAEVHAKLAYTLLDNFNDWNSNSQKKCEVQWSRTQGFKANVEAVQNSPALRRCLPSNFRPLLLQNGKRIPFPTKDSKLDQEGTLFQNGEHVPCPKKNVGMRKKKLSGYPHLGAGGCMGNMHEIITDDEAYGA
jgi:RNA recognition motif-containing protein